MSNQLFENLDSDVFKPELVESLKVEFENSVNEAVDAKILVATAEIEDRLLQESETKIAEVTEKLIAENAEAQAVAMVEVSEKLNDYLSVVVDELVSESEGVLVNEENQAKLTAMIEAFSGFVITTGVDVAVINEAKDNVDVDTKYADQVEANNALVEQNLELIAQNKKFLQMGVINEMKSGLSIVQAERFERLSALVEFSNDVSYGDKLETLKESITGKVEPEKESIEEEPVKDLNESFVASSIPSHLM